MMSTPLSFKKVSISYEQAVLTSVDFELPAGKVVAIGGEPGSGKGTFLKIAAGLVEPDEGELILFEKNFWGLRRSEMSRLRSQTTFFFREGALLANMSVFDNLALPLRYNQSLEEGEVESRIVPLLEKLKLLKYREQLPASLTLKLKLRAALARTLIIEKPGIYFWNGPEDLGGDARGTVEQTIAEGRARGAPSLITGNTEWTKSLSDISFKLIDGSLKPW